MNYTFYGLEKADTKPISDKYKGICNPCELYEAPCLARDRTHHPI